MENLDLEKNYYFFDHATIPINVINNPEWSIDDFFTCVYVIVDDIYLKMVQFLKKTGPKPLCSDSEIITMSLVAECKGWNKETEMISHLTQYKYLFPHIPSRTRFNRRRRNLQFVINNIRRILLSHLDLAKESTCIIDSLPIPVVEFHLVPSHTGPWSAYRATFGRISSKKQTIFGYKLHLLCTIHGVIIDFELAPANAADIHVGFEILENHTDLKVIGDKAYISEEIQNELLEKNRIKLITLPRRNQKKQINSETRRFINSARQMIETVNSQLSDQFQIERHYAHSFWGLCARLYTKITAHTISIYINRLLGSLNPLQIKKLAFPNVN